MTTVVTAYDAIKALAEANITLPRKYQNDDNVLPDTPAAFVYFDLDPKRAYVGAYGGGRGQNDYHNPFDLYALVFVPRGTGSLRDALDKAETVAAVFRSYRDADITLFAASVHPVGQGAEIIPKGLQSAADNYACAVVIISGFFRQTG